MPIARHKTLPGGKGHGWRKDSIDPRDHKMSMIRGAPLPKQIALDETFLPPVRDQGSLGSCTGFGTTGAFMYLVRKHKAKPISYSPLFVYYQERVIENDVSEDAGAEIRDGVKVLANIGVCPETSWPYVIGKFARTPTKTAVKAAAPHKIARYLRCDTVDDVRRALSLGMPVVGGFTCFTSLESNATAKTGVVPMPVPREKVIGGHCVWICAADADRRLFKFQNSWSADWGDKGFGYLPFDYLEHKLADDFWTFDLA